MELALAYLAVAGEVYNLENVDADAPPKDPPPPTHHVAGVRHVLAALCFCDRLCLTLSKHTPPPHPPSEAEGK